MTIIRSATRQVAVEGRSYMVGASDLPTARSAARQQARLEGHPTPDEAIIYAEDIGPSRYGGRLFEIVILVDELA